MTFLNLKSHHCNNFRNRSGFTLVEMMISFMLMGASVLAVTQLYTFRIQDQSSIRATTQVVSVAQEVITNYYAFPTSYPWIAPTSSTASTIYMACYDGATYRLVKDYSIFSVGTSTANDQVNAVTNTAGTGSGYCNSDNFEVRLVPPAANVGSGSTSYRPAFKVYIVPVSAAAVFDKKPAIHNSSFEMVIDQGFSTAILANP